MKTLHISEYQDHPELWRFSVIVDDKGTATVYEDGDILPPEYQPDYVDPETLPELTVKDMLNLLTEKAIITKEDVTAAKVQVIEAGKLDASTAAIG